jgi:hypothetical protein
MRQLGGQKWHRGYSTSGVRPDSRFVSNTKLLFSSPTQQRSVRSSVVARVHAAFLSISSDSNRLFYLVIKLQHLIHGNPSFQNPPPPSISSHCSGFLFL